MTTPAPNWGRIPEALRQRDNWCVAGPDKSPYYLPHPAGVLARASVTDRKTLMPFNTAASIAYSLGQGIGYVCQADDPFTCIDLDIKNQTTHPDKPDVWSTPEQMDRAWAIVREFETYTERSRSGVGLHLWVGGKIGQGARRENVEVYSQERFIICTGDVVVDMPITPGQPLLDKLLEQIRSAQGARSELVEQEETADDRELVERAMYAANGPKFNDLCGGRWESMGFPSQSEADLALMSMFTFYSPSNEQCKRLFRMSKLGKREKAQKDDRYLNKTLELIRGRQQREAKVDENTRAQAKALVDSLLKGHAAQQASEAAGVAVPTSDGHNGASHPNGNGHPALNGYQSHEGILYDEPGLAWPPGFAGHLARFVYHSAPRPVREVAIVSALGLLAGICGRAYTIPQSGLNLYIILVARSAIGKEAMHSGISLLLNAALNAGLPTANNFIDFNDYVSGQALAKRCAEVQSFVNVAGEWGRKLKRLAGDDGKDSSMGSLRTVMTNLYQKSGPKSVVGGLSYSNKDNNVSSVSGVAFSMVGETTPDQFYESLNESMMADGFLSRFTIIEYSGDRPPTNHRQVLELEPWVKEKYCSIVHQSLHMNSTGQNHQVSRTDEAGQILVAFDQECDGQIRSTKEESWRQMWNRAHLKVLRIAALLACADNELAPVMTKDHVDWALTVVRADIKMMADRMQAGDVGQDDTSRERKILDISQEFFTKPVKESYKIPTAMREHSIVPRKYLQLRTQQVSAFRTYRNGATAALDASIRSLCDSGYFIEMPKDKVVDAYGFHGKCYRVIDLGTLKH